MKWLDIGVVMVVWIVSCVVVGWFISVVVFLV